jgi:hypothetical protein
MNIKKIVLILGLIGYAGVAGFAQDKAALTKPEAVTQQQNKIKTIFNYKSELGLTDKQVADLVAILTGFQKYLNEQSKEMKELRLKLNDLIKQKADLKSIRETLEQIARVQVEASYTDVETSRKVEATLTPSQLKKWTNIQESAQKQEIQARQLQKLQDDQKTKNTTK